MKKLSDWFIKRYPVDEYALKQLAGRPYLGEEYYYNAYGNYKEDSAPSEKGLWRTSSIKQLEFIEESGILKVHTLNSVYYCHIDDCKRRKQAPFDILPEPVRKIANEKLYPLVNELVEDNTILLAFDINDSNLNFVDALCNRDGHITRLTPQPHLGMFTDSVFIRDSFGVDIRYYAADNWAGDYIEFYGFKNDGLSVCLYNVGERPLSFKLFEESILLNPGEKKLVAGG